MANFHSGAMCETSRAIAVSLVLATCVWAGDAGAGDRPESFGLSSSAFKANAAIPAQYACDGPDRSPALSWSGSPAATKSFALIADDPDAPVGTWVHWVLYDLPGDRNELPAGIPTDETVLGGAKQGVNDFRKVGYNGPCPPPGKPHRYFFKLYALDRSTGLKPRATKAEVLRAIEGHVLAQAELIGAYKH